MDLTQQAEKLASEGLFDEAIRICTQGLAAGTSDINSLFSLVQKAVKTGKFAPECLERWGITAHVRQHTPGSIDPAMARQVLEKVLIYPHEQTLTFAEACLESAEIPELFADTVMSVAMDMAYQSDQAKYGMALAELCLKVVPGNFEILKHLTGFCSHLGAFSQAIIWARKLYEQCDTAATKLFGNHLLLRALLEAGAWEEVSAVADRHKSLLAEVEESETTVPESTADSLIVTAVFLPYLQDDQQQNRRHQNRIAEIFQRHCSQETALVPASKPAARKKSRPLRVGYIASTLRQHSVGWLSRWVFRYHDRDQFKVALYLVGGRNDWMTESWFRNTAPLCRNMGRDAAAIAGQIRKDGIDILVDLDSATLDITCQVMALKSAPVQVTWLGWDASGLPAIDYFIADPYVLSADADAWYRERIWRMPATYVAVDGFEVGTPTLRRENLGIPADAIVYLSVQSGMKRHPDTARLQLEILKQVPGSYFLIKGLSDEAVLKQLFCALVKEARVDPDRIRFLPWDSSELTHRANLRIADVILDTYPYNGATTTLEALWMGIPVVTKVGRQFSARTSYSFMTNAGIMKGMAWSDEEYVEWGMNLGADERLRQTVALELEKSRRTSPLWDAKQFTREIEKAYQHMWEGH